MVLNQFGGGLSKRLSPHLIQVNEATIFKNIDNSGEYIQSIKGNTSTAQNFGSDGSFIYFKGQWISGPLATSFVEFNNNLYYTTGTGKLLKNNGISELTVGLSKPTTKLVTTTSVVSVTISNNDIITTNVTLEAKTYEYLLVYYIGDTEYNIKQDKFSYTGVNGIKLDITLPQNITKAFLYRDYNNTYRLVSEVNSSGIIIDKTLDILKNATIDYLSFKSLSGTRQYCYTYYREVDGTESAPSEYSNDISYEGNDITLVGFQASSDLTVTGIRIYRIGGDLTEMTLVDEVSLNTTSYIDSKLDEDIAGELLSTIGTMEPPEDLNHLTEYSTTLFAVKDNELWFSESGIVDLWNAFNFITFNEAITGLGATQNGLLVFTRNKTYIILGTDTSNFTKRLLNDSQGCIQHKSIRYVDNTLIWLSLDGICASTGGKIDIISLNKLGKLNVEPITSSFYEEEYYLFHTTGTIVVDFREGIRFKELDLVVNGAYYSSQFDKLYILNPEDFGMYEFGTSETLVPYVFKSGWLTDNGLTNLKTYSHIYISIIGTSSLIVYVDGIEANTYVLTNGVNDIKLPKGFTKGYYIELEFTGTGEIYEIEFKTEGRQNAR